MLKLFSLSALLIAPLLIGGCAGGEGTIAEGFRKSPTGALLRGDIPADRYFAEVARANEESRERDQFEVNRDPTRAYNPRTGKIEHVGPNVKVYWNEQNRRWEFLPHGEEVHPDSAPPAEATGEPQAPES
jgi:hypothetical protein